MKRAHTILAIITLCALALVIFYALFSVKQSPAMRDAQRSSDVYLIQGALLQYAKDHNGSFPLGLSSDELEICKTASADCTGLLDLSELTADQKYAASMPLDPQCSVNSANCSENGTGYIVSLTQGKVTVTAYGAEDDDISITR